MDECQNNQRFSLVTFWQVGVVDIVLGGCGWRHFCSPKRILLNNLRFPAMVNRIGKQIQNSSDYLKCQELAKYDPGNAEKMKTSFLSLYLWKAVVEKKALSAFKTLYMDLYFSIFISKEFNFATKPTQVQQHLVSILMENAQSLKKRNLNKKQKRRLEILKNKSEQSSQPIDISFQKKFTQKSPNQRNNSNRTKLSLCSTTKANPQYLRNC